MNMELEKAASILNEGIILELELQGHTLLDELENTIRGNVKIRNQRNRQILEGGAVSYIRKMEDGVLPNQLGSPERHLEVLTIFYQRLGFNAVNAAKKARKLLPHHFREGVPTEYSKVYSLTGERQGFIKAAWRKTEKQVDNVVTGGMDNVFMTEFNKQKSDII